MSYNVLTYQYKYYAHLVILLSLLIICPVKILSLSSVIFMIFLTFKTFYTIFNDFQTFFNHSQVLLADLLIITTVYLRYFKYFYCLPLYSSCNFNYFNLFPVIPQT